MQNCAGTYTLSRDPACFFLSFCFFGTPKADRREKQSFVSTWRATLR